MMESFLTKEMVEKLSSRREVSLYIKNEKLILNFHPNHPATQPPHKISRIKNLIVIMAASTQIL